MLKIINILVEIFFYHKFKIKNNSGNFLFHCNNKSIKNKAELLNFSNIMISDVFSV